jgi:hypothetical protein
MSAARRRARSRSWARASARALSASTNGAGRSTILRRTLYGAPRGVGAVRVVETRNYKLDPFVTLRVRKVF